MEHYIKIATESLNSLVNQKEYALTKVSEKGALPWEIAEWKTVLDELENDIWNAKNRLKNCERIANDGYNRNVNY